MLLKLLILCAAICILMATAFVVLYFLGLIVVCLRTIFQRKKKKKILEDIFKFLHTYDTISKNAKEKKDEVEPK